MWAPRRANETEVTTDLTTGLLDAAARHIARLPARERWIVGGISQLTDMAVALDEEVCRDIADRYDRAPYLDLDDALTRRYEHVKKDSIVLYQELLVLGVTIEPWRGPGQPYRDSNELRRQVNETRTLRVFLTANGHGSFASRGFHPLCCRSGVAAEGVELWHNDLLRAVHDLFGHVMLSTGFGPKGEFKAAYCQLALSSEAARPALFTEQVAQTCWFYFGAHLRDENGKVPRHGDRGYVSPRDRPYPEQKVFASEPADLHAFQRMFHFKEL
ncbi:crotonobetainyl-CoA--carnitine CoA-transferase [Mycobacterium sp.]|uniref:crotonobetainyl-CoA--carnitine CoA-transferase n=1 Tax=Mycobacterium sp. TaxID=1785 RepID=UPI002C08BDE1|nr:crotonobetainyl-CoA--carnitine CoA-transferase [Mycobacterium sp.]HTY35361.1 crotonobetainyl-CoA--carnitine CoA-transferase [Mycobacterium sp.]